MSKHPLRIRRSAVARGQATVEFVVLGLFVFIPFCLALPLVGKYIDMYQASEEASRYVAFEAAARNTSSSWKTDDELAVEVRRRFFSNGEAPIKTGDAAGDYRGMRNPFWSDAAGNPLIEKFDEAITVSSNKDSLNAIAATGLYRSAMGLSIDNQYTGKVTLKIKDIPGFQPFDAIGLETTRKTVLLADAWTGRDPGTIRGKIEDSTLLYPSDSIALVLDVMGTLPAVVFDPTFRVGDFNWDLVPCDRLAGGC